jgi:hypothetical protein
LEFCGGIFEIIAGAGVVAIVQEPLHRVHVDPDINGVRF